MSREQPVLREQPVTTKSGNRVRVPTVLISLTLNVCLTAAVILWLAGQLTVPVVWGTFGGNEYTIQIDGEGWILQQSSLLHNSVVYESPTGITSHHRPGVRNAAAPEWDDVLADSSPRHPIPGLILASGTQFRIVAVRHWLIVFGILITWTYWRQRRHSSLCGNQQTACDSVSESDSNLTHKQAPPRSN